MLNQRNTLKRHLASRTLPHQFEDSYISSGTTRTCPFCGLVAYGVDERGNSVLWEHRVRAVYGRDFSRTSTRPGPCRGSR